MYIPSRETARSWNLYACTSNEHQDESDEENGTNRWSFANEDLKSGGIHHGDTWVTGTGAHVHLGADVSVCVSK